MNMANTKTARTRRRMPLLTVALAMSAGLLSGCAPTAAPAPNPTREKPAVAAFIGDSYTSGHGASSPTLAWASMVAAEEGWKVVNLGRGGTGYLTTSGVNGCGEEYCPNYQEMVPEVVKARPDVVVIAGGQNDFTAFSQDPDAVRSAIEATYTAVRQELPDARILAVGPSIPSAAPPGPTATGFDAIVQEAAEAVDATYISMLDPAVFTDAMILPDGGHVNDDGHAAIAERVLAALGG
jgi:lysophospholipase L1-like esterase